MLHGPQRGLFELDFRVPSGCADQLAAGAADIGIVPCFELTRQDLMDLIDAGLRRTGGSYRDLLGVFNLPITQYKLFHAFLYQHNCNLPVGTYRRMAKAEATPVRVPRRASAAC